LRGFAKLKLTDFGSDLGLRFPRLRATGWHSCLGFGKPKPKATGTGWGFPKPKLMVIAMPKQTDFEKDWGWHFR